ncbi:TonB-dependent receptor [Altererythrobacter sp.]|uniref:TonB-dependent receptor n=1 Tax=Altererythrobacter sp. TaxID=1872480 RepID=UPI003D025A63
MRFSTSALHWTVSSVALAFAAPTLAQTDETDDDRASEIIVTAQFREQNLQDTPIAITALNAEMIEARGQEALDEIGTSAPNVTLREAPATYGPAVVAYIRGVGQRDTTFALEPGVGIYIDDIYFPTLHGSMIQLVDLERAEILRGPQGTLAGQNSIGGAIKLYSKKPTGSGEGYVQATYGSYNRMELRAAADFALADGLFARISGTGAQSDGYIKRYDYACSHPGTPIPTSIKTPSDNCKLGTSGGKEYLAGRLALRWEPSSSVTVDLVGDIVEDDSETSASTLLYVGRSAAPGTDLPGSTTAPAYVLNGVQYGTAAGSPFISYSPYGNYALDSFSSSPYINYENFADLSPRDGSPPYQAPLTAAVDSWGLSLNVAIELSDSLNLTSITGYREYDGLYSTGEGSPFTNTSQINRIFNEQFSQELRLSGEIGDAFNFTIGGFYFDKKSRNASYIGLSSFAFTEENHIPAETIAAFANVEIRPTDSLTLVGGVRYTDQEKTFKYGRFGVPGSDGTLNGSGFPPGSPGTDGAAPFQVAPLNGREETFKGDRFDYRAVAQYRFTDDMMGYVQFSTGFKGGGINPRPFFPAQALPHNPETLDAYEVGLKSSLFDRRLRLNAAAFLNKYSDILVTTNVCPLPGAPPAPCALPLNAGKADVKGFELELNAEPVDGFLLDASLAYLDFDYKNINEVAATSGIGIEDNGQYIQQWQWSIGAQYVLDLGDSGTLTPRIDVTFEDDFDRNANNVDAATGSKDIFGHIDSRVLVNARLSYRSPGEDWEISLEGKNLTDKLYYTDVFDNRGSTQSIQGTPGMPRTFAVTLKYLFGR